MSKTPPFNTDWTEIQTIQALELFGGKSVLMKNTPLALGKPNYFDTSLPNIKRNFWLPSFADNGMAVMRVCRGLRQYRVVLKIDKVANINRVVGGMITVAMVMVSLLTFSKTLAVLLVKAAYFHRCCRFVFGFSVQMNCLKY